jgi:dihydroneopterin aldolase
MEFFSYHGCFEEEQIIGNKFLVSIDIETDFSKAAINDNLEDTINYQSVYNIINKEMTTASKLLENTAYRIINKLFETFNQIQVINIIISKLNPPIGGKVEKVSIRMKTYR